MNARLRRLWGLAALPLLIPFATPDIPADSDGQAVRIRVLAYNIKHGEGMDGQVDLERSARVILAICANNTRHNVSIGNDNARISCHTDSKSDIVAIDGNHLKFTANTSTSSVAMKNSGTATRHSVVNVIARS